MPGVRVESMRQESVYYIPERLEPGVLYVSAEFDTAVHLCACGCGEKVVTPTGPNWWTLSEGPTLSPSIGNWQIPCRTHYWIRNGKVVWA